MAKELVTNIDSILAMFKQRDVVWSINGVDQTDNEFYYKNVPLAPLPLLCEYVLGSNAATVQHNLARRIAKYPELKRHFIRDALPVGLSGGRKHKDMVFYWVTMEGLADIVNRMHGNSLRWLRMVLSPDGADPWDKGWRQRGNLIRTADKRDRKWEHFGIDVAAWKAEGLLGPDDPNNPYDL